MNVYSAMIQEALGRLPTKLNDQPDSIQIDTTPCQNLKTRGKSFSLAQYKGLFDGIEGVSVDEHRVTLSKKMSGTNFQKVFDAVVRLTNQIYQDNLANKDFWAKPSHIVPSGFNEKKETDHSHSLLSEIYNNDLIVKEKKPFVIDLDRSHGSYMISVEPEQNSIIDAAAQIASLSLGFNDASKRSMNLRPEVFRTDLDWNTWDIFNGFKDLLTEKCGLKNLAVVNSGAEAVELSVRACQKKYPKRRRIVAFEGAFHGRSVLSIHATYNPAKRAMFEIDPKIVEHLPFPEQKNPLEEAPEPSDWIETWSQGKNVSSAAEKYLKSNDKLIAQETETLLALAKTILNDTPLAVLIEPIQCEGGDKFGTNRFFRALRVLTRALDVPLIFDEVQAGLGLGGTFFWHTAFDLVDKNGKPDTPDCLALAKKTQVGLVLSNLELDADIECNPGSLYRGYLQAVGSLEADFKTLETKVEMFLKSFEEILDPEVFQNPRNRGLAFAFDLPNTEVMTALVGARFESGTLFYPAGEKTARFRLLASTTDDELAHIFGAIYRCYLKLSADKKIYQVPSFESWAEKLPSSIREKVLEKPTIDATLPWTEEQVPSDYASFEKITDKQWNRMFSNLVKRFPQLLLSEASRNCGLWDLDKMSKEDLWDKYEKGAWTHLDLIWMASRRLGFDIKRLTRDQIGDLRTQIDEIEKAVYEPERQDDPEMFYELAKDKEMTFLGAVKDGKLIGFTAACPAKHFKHVPLVNSDPHLNDPKCLYSMDCSVRPEHQGQGLGFRLKCEQFMLAHQKGAKFMRSRNRHPEAKAMNKLNRRLGSVVLAQNREAYGGDGQALYQSIGFDYSSPDSAKNEIFHPYFPALRNKTSLGNFVSTSYIHNMQLLGETLPKNVRHLYLSSGRAEATDKAFKLLRFKRPEGKFALSFKGDYFGKTTACARSLGDQAGLPFFDWPVLDDSEDFAKVEKQLGQHKPSDIYGVFVEPQREKNGKKRSKEFLSALVKWGKTNDVPIVFDETASAFGQYEPSQMFASSIDSLTPDIFFYYPGPGFQLGVVASNDDLYLDKPLTMISTWDGDEHSLNMLREKVLGFYDALP